MEQQAGQHGEPQRLVVGDREHTRHPEANGADVGIGRRAERVGAAAPHLGLRLELDVCFQPDDRFVFRSHRRQLCHSGGWLNTFFGESVKR